MVEGHRISKLKGTKENLLKTDDFETLRAEEVVGVRSLADLGLST